MKRLLAADPGNRDAEFHLIADGLTKQLEELRLRERDSSGAERRQHLKPAARSSNNAECAARNTSPSPTTPFSPCPRRSPRGRSTAHRPLATGSRRRNAFSANI